MLKVLFTDFYRPIQLGELFRELYPNEYFHHNTSKERLYKIFLNLKFYLENQDLPFEIKWFNNQVKWIRRREFILTTIEETQINKKLKFIKNNLPNRFSIHDLSNSLKKSQRSSERFIVELIEKKLLRRLRAGHFEIK